MFFQICFDEYINKDIDRKINTKLLELYSNYNDDQLEYALYNGIPLTENVVLHFNRGRGFTCYNKNKNIVGRLPMCVLIEKNLNNGLRNLIKS